MLQSYVITLIHVFLLDFDVEANKEKMNSQMLENVFIYGTFSTQSEYECILCCALDGACSGLNYHEWVML